MKKINFIRKKYKNHYIFFSVILENYKIIENILFRLIEKQKKHKNSWINESIDKLDKRIKFIFKVYESRKCIKELQQKALLDLINQCILLLIRLKEIDKNEKN